MGSLATTRAGELAPGSWFKLKMAGDDGTFSFFKLVTLHPGCHVSVYGGDLDPNGRRQWHSFTEARVVDEARPLTARELDAVTVRR